MSQDKRDIAIEKAKKIIEEHPDKNDYVCKYIVRSYDHNNNPTDNSIELDEFWEDCKRIIAPPLPSKEQGTGAEGVIEHANGTAIINGGNPLLDCPKNWDEAKLLLEDMNKGKDEFAEPKWSFDCGFKLDFDGSLISVSSRFYPPKTDYGTTWDGNVTISIMGKELSKEHFDCPTLEILNTKVELYVKGFAKRVVDALLLLDQEENRY